VVSTAIVAAVATASVALVTNRPFAVVPAMGTNAYVALAISEGGARPKQALAAAFVAGILFSLAAVTRMQSKLAHAVPSSLRIAAVTGIGLFIALVGFQNSELVVAGELGNLEDPSVWLFIAGFCLLIALDTFGVRSAVLTTMVVITSISWGSKLSERPSQIASVPDHFDSLWQISFTGWTSETYIGLATLVYTDVLVQSSSLAALNSLEGVRLPGAAPGALPKNAWKVWLTVGLSTCLSAALGCTPVLPVMESAVGIRSGGRTGLTAWVVAVLYALSALFAPILAKFPAAATSCPLIIVGVLMMNGIERINWSDHVEAVPAFVTIAMIPFTFDVGKGLIAGLLVSTVCRTSLQLRDWLGAHNSKNGADASTADADHHGVVTTFSAEELIDCDTSDPEKEHPKSRSVLMPSFAAHSFL